MDMATAQQVANPYYQQMMLQPQMYMDYYRMGELSLPFFFFPFHCDEK